VPLAVAAVKAPQARLEEKEEEEEEEESVSGK
jgi:hypothetical protein